MIELTMIHLIPVCFAVVLVGSLSGCREAVPITSPISVVPVASASQSPTPKELHTVELSDLLDALDLRLWKAPLNRVGDEPVRKISLCLKPQGGDSKTV